MLDKKYKKTKQKLSIVIFSPDLVSLISLQMDNTKVGYFEFDNNYWLYDRRFSLQTGHLERVCKQARSF